MTYNLGLLIFLTETNLPSCRKQVNFQNFCRIFWSLNNSGDLGNNFGPFINIRFVTGMKVSSVLFILALCIPVASVTGGLLPAFSLFCANPRGCFRSECCTGWSQWQHRAWIVSLFASINAEHEAWQVASTVIQVSGMTRPGIKPSLTALGARA